MKNGTQFIELEEGRHYIVFERKLWEKNGVNIQSALLSNLQIMYGKFELLVEEKEIDIQAIEEIYELMHIDDYDEEGNVLRMKINELIKAIKQLDKKIKE